LRSLASLAYLRDSIDRLLDISVIPVIVYLVVKCTGHVVAMVFTVEFLASPEHVLDVCCHDARDVLELFVELGHLLLLIARILVRPFCFLDKGVLMRN